MPPPKVYVANLVTNYHAPADLSEHFKTALKRPAVKALSAHLAANGFKPATTGKDAFFGVTERYKSSDGKTATVDVRVQSYQKAGSKDKGAVGTVTVKSGVNTEVYQFALVAPKGNFAKAEEHTVDPNNNVKKANSWWSCWVACLRRRCITTCLTSLVTCGGTWAAYFWCVVAKCGGCVLGCSGCCGCDCSWWCRWAAGCCDR